MSTVNLRPWQRAAFDRFQANTDIDYLAVATPGAGKTTFALTCARAALAERNRPLVVVAPTSHLKIQWSQAAHRMGLELETSWAPGDGIARDVHGLVTTYQQLATGNAASKLAGLAQDGFVILDEIHHAGHERAWGDGIRKAFAHASKRLALSGTPFRSDSVQIPFVRYEEVDTQARVPDGFLRNPANDREITTWGLSYKPHPQVVIKLDWMDVDNAAGTGQDQVNLALGFLF